MDTDLFAASYVANMGSRVMPKMPGTDMRGFPGGGSSEGESSPMLVPGFIMREQDYENLMAGGKDALLRLIAKDPSKFRGALKV